MQRLSPQVQVIAEPGAPSLSNKVAVLVDQLWSEAISKQGDTLFNGRVFAFKRLTADRIVGSFVEYKLIFAQLKRPDLFREIGLRSLGVRGITIAQDNVLLGRRGSCVATYQNHYELAPSGNLDQQHEHSGRVDFRQQLLQELVEETGIADSRVMQIIPFGLCLSNEYPVMDLCCYVLLSGSKTPLAATDEYSELKWLTVDELQSGICVPVVPKTLDIVQFALNGAEPKLSTLTTKGIK